MGPIIAAVYIMVSLATFAIFAVDKRAAGASRRRVPESTLHGLELVGGWPGAFAAIKLLRHKSAKPRFYLVTWAIAGLHVAGWAAWFILA